MHHMHLQLFNVSLPLQKTLPFANFFSTEGKAAFRSIPMDSAWWRTADEIGYITTFSGFLLPGLLLFPLQDKFPLFKILGYILLSQLKSRLWDLLLSEFFQQRMDKPTGVLEQQWGISGGAWGTRGTLTKRTLVWEQCPRHTSQY